MDDSRRSQELRSFIRSFAESHNLRNTIASLDIIREYSRLMTEKDDVVYFLVNCQSAARMLINLNLPFDSFDLDCTLSAALLHTVAKHVPSIDFGLEMVEYNGIDQRVCEVVRKITLRGQSSEEEIASFYDQMKNDRIALIVRLAERSNLVERLSTVSATKAKAQIAETKRYFFPMCVYAKEHYPELGGQICILMEKMRNLVDAADILIDQFDAREKELSRDILVLLEENSRLRSMIRKIESD